MKKLIIILIVVLSNNLFAQEKYTIKTNEIYINDLIISQDMIHKGVLVEWEINFKNKEIYFTINKNINTFKFTKNELIKDENGEVVIEFENKNEVIYFSTYYNYVKILHFSNLKLNSFPKEYTKITTYSNYDLKDFIDITNYNIN
jgi:hypothetical protein